MTTNGPRGDGGNHAAAAQPPARLALRSDLPPRVHKAFDALLDLAQAYFDAALPKTLDEVEHALFTLAERARNNTQQQRHFEALREMKRGRHDIAPRFMQHLESSLAQLRTPAPARAPAETGAGARHSLLELVETAALDEGLALRDIAGKADVRHSQALYAYAHRLAVLTSTPVWAVDALPLGPTQLGAALQHALRDLDLAVDTRVLAYRHFDRIALLPIAAFYDGVNTCLIEQQILPNLQWQTNYRYGAAGHGTPDESADGTPLPTTAPAPTAPVQPAATPGAGPSASGGNAQAAPLDVVDAALFTTLRNLLGEQRRREGAFRAALPGGSPASRDDLQNVLGSLQRKSPAAGTTVQGYPDSEHLKNSLMVKLRRGPSGRPLGLAAEDADTVDLVGMLFDHIATDLRGSSDAQSLLGRLQVPVLRVALNDKTFFTRRDHPARELLNTIAETCSRWIDEGDADPDLVEQDAGRRRARHREFDGDLGVFAHLLGDLSRHMQALARRAEVVERRHVDAARGRDKLEIARETARSAIARVLHERHAGPLVRNAARTGVDRCAGA